MSGYLFVYFTSDSEDRENIWFSLSRDGLHWQDLGGREPFLSSNIGTKGIRDPFILHDDSLGKYFILATDLKTEPGADWDLYRYSGSRSILIFESEDLVHWDRGRLAELAVREAGCAWAPEAVFCRERGEWLVFFASCVERKQRIYAAFTKDFKVFGETFVYIDTEQGLIDTSIFFDNGCYYRFSKEETGKTIVIERAGELLSDQYETLYCRALDGYYGLEGPEVYYLEDKHQWCLVADRYKVNEGYLPFVCDHLETADFRILNEDEYDMGWRKKRHGSVIQISDEAYERLKAADERGETGQDGPGRMVE